MFDLDHREAAATAIQPVTGERARRESDIVESGSGLDVITSESNSLDGNAEEANWIVRTFEVAEELNTTHTIRVTLDTDEAMFDPSGLLGADLEVAGRCGQAVRRFHGIVQSVRLGMGASDSLAVDLIVVPAFTLLQ